jgi:hypothetical protein
MNDEELTAGEDGLQVMRQTGVMTNLDSGFQVLNRRSQVLVAVVATVIVSSI